MAARKFFINMGADPASALVESFTSAVTLGAEDIAFRRDDTLNIELHFLKPNPAPNPSPDRPFVYVDPASWNTIRVGVGTVDAEPTGGTWTFTDTSASQTTAAIAYNASAATVQTAIRAACTTNFSACTVTGDAGGPYVIDRVTTGAFASDPTGSPAGLTPSGSVVSIVNTETGTSLLSEKWQLTLASAVPIYRDTGWDALASASVSVSTVQSGSASANKVFRVTWNADAYAGAVVLAFTGDTVTGTVALPYNATPEQVLTAFELHTDVEDNGVTVTQSAPGDYTIELVGAGIKASNTPALATASNTLSVPVGLSEALGCNTALVQSLLAGATSATATLEVEIQQTAGVYETVVSRDDASIFADLLRNSTSSSYDTATLRSVLATPSGASGTVVWPSDTITFPGNVRLDYIIAAQNAGVDISNSSGDTVAIFGFGPAQDTWLYGALELGHASDTTLARSSAGNVTIEGNVIYRAGGTDVPVADGGTGSSTAVGARANLAVRRYDVVILEDQKSSGTSGGATSAATWHDRTLNTEVTDSAGLCTPNVDGDGFAFQLAAGTWLIEWTAPGYTCGRIRSALYNKTDSTYVAYGTSVASFAGGDADQWSEGSFIVTIGSAKKFVIKMYAQSAIATFGLGLASSAATEIYTRVKAVRLEE